MPSDGDESADESEPGLYDKYRVEKEGELVFGAFVLEPALDANARAAIRAYADATDNDDLAHDLRQWMDELEDEDAR